ncbi:MAG TPA: GDP-mannose 4,6-dehydratase [Verrucomicrobiae bacterium]|nr:GDP-mannose 4,6-dehydratase [Verrucomicrobiae bacterium]
MPRALITGIAGQDGSYLAEFLLAKGYEVAGIIRRARTERHERIAHIQNRLQLHEGDVLDQVSLTGVLQKFEPDEVYNLASQSSVFRSWAEPILTGEINALGVSRLLEAIRSTNPKIKFYQASSSEMFGKVRESPQNELTPFYPRSPYGVSKTYGHFVTVNYRESYGIFAASGILFNHESPRRGLDFVTRKITHGAASIAAGRSQTLVLGNLDVERDWGFAGDYVEAMWLMLQQPAPEDFVIGQGKAHSLRDFLGVAFEHVGLNWEKFVQIDPKLLRPAEVEHVVADCAKAHAKLGWKPHTSFRELVGMMVDSDVQLLKAQSSAR